MVKGRISLHNFPLFLILLSVDTINHSAPKPTDATPILVTLPITPLLLPHLHLASDNPQALGNVDIHYALTELIKKDKNEVAKKFPDTDMDTILAVANDINVVIIYLCYSDHRLFSHTNGMNHQFYEFAQQKAALLK